jgi:hypothetical protein
MLAGLVLEADALEQLSALRQRRKPRMVIIDGPPARPPAAVIGWRRKT